MERSQGPITSVAEHNGMILTGPFNGRIVQRGVSDAAPLRTLELGKEKVVTALAISRDGETMLYATDNLNGPNEALLVHTDNFEQQTTLWSATDDITVSTARFSPDGKRLIVGVNSKQVTSSCTMLKP
ncbi:MAG: hypothetical protein VCD00_14710 [Candidatus Hydrogenedentota bacterium]